MEITENFERTIEPFFWVDHDESASVCLNVGEYLQDVFDGRADDGFEGNGYDRASLAQVFLNEKCRSCSARLTSTQKAACSAHIPRTRRRSGNLF